MKSPGRASDSSASNGAFRSSAFCSAWLAAVSVAVPLHRSSRPQREALVAALLHARDRASASA